MDTCVGGVAPTSPAQAHPAEAHFGERFGIAGTMLVDTGGTLDAGFTRGFADILFDDGGRLVAKFIAPFCGPTE